MKTFVYCNPYFHKDTYAKLLRKMGVDTEIVKEGVMINLDQYKANYHSSKAPYLIQSNHCFVKRLY